MKIPSCLCGSCHRCRQRVYNRNYELRKKMAAEKQNPANTPVKKRLPEKQRGRRVPSHNQALRFDARKRPFDPVAAAEHISAVFTECPGADKPHLLARIKMIVGDVDPMWGGFRFPPITQNNEQFNPPAPLDDWPPKAKPQKPVETDVESAGDSHKRTEPVIDRPILHEIDGGESDPGATG